jgi:hypothetical protein
VQAIALNSSPAVGNYALLSAVAFLGGFSDRFSIQLLGRLAGKWAEDGEPSSGKEGRQAANADATGG